MEALVAYLLVIGLTFLICIIFWIIEFEKKSREEGTLEERRLNPDLNTNDPILHKNRLSQFQRSKFQWTTYYMGKKGGIYTVSYNGNKVYKHQ